MTDLLRVECHESPDHRRSAPRNCPVVPDIVIQRILRHVNVSTTASYYVKSAADDVRNAMAKLENQLAVTVPRQKRRMQRLDERRTTGRGSVARLGPTVPLFHPPDVVPGRFVLEF